ncbi:superinfection immunity protein [Pseudomonas protegens]|uniref:superinfection immunity protein n=1 Tax=Pseudomonas protegens TaxID=380021 RepID=UPI00382778C5
MADNTGMIGSLMLLFVGVVLYFLPTINAKSRKHPNRGPIFLLNLFLGWTLIGWVVAVVWSASAIQGLSSGSENSEDKYRQLEKLGALKERGLLSETEYEAEKAKLLQS